jgi:hypothetical protein
LRATIRCPNRSDREKRATEMAQPRQRVYATGIG